MTFLWPWAFLGLLSLPALAAIYWLRQRARERPVSSLLLWREQLESRASGRRFDRFEASRLFFLELLILALVTLAAAGPRVLTERAQRPLVVVLDDSYSMSAGGERSPREAARRALLRELDDAARHASVQLVLAGPRPQVVAGETLTPDAVAPYLARDWQTRAASAALAPAVNLAREVAGEDGRILVLSDQAPPERLLQGAVEWWAFGTGSANAAIVNALRGEVESEVESCLVEIANYTAARRTLQPRLLIAEQPATSLQAVELGSGEVGRLRFRVPARQVAALELEEDGLKLDDRIVLLPSRRRPVRVDLDVTAPDVRREIREALRATQRVVFSDERPDLRIDDGGAETVRDASVGDAWHLSVLSASSAKPFVGPFVLDRGHPLTEGLDLEGVIWAANEPSQRAGVPVVMAGELALLSDRESANGTHRLLLSWRRELSTLQRTPNWPILWQNLIDWRGGSVPGVRSTNLRLGEQVSIGLVPGSEEAELELPDGSRRTLGTRGDLLTLEAEHVGIHQLRHGGRSDRWVVNALSAAESDLRETVSGRWGDWGDARILERESRAVGWIPLLLALALVALHGIITAVSRAGAAE